ncbi:hypothetical protein PCANC_14404 [Puccinia coronata f. sp. avenae]|uniref:Uncharacterized protein n=1 Tax=Puccinia coronata f. sp. avenae TaxID=200324 RepID=A0A2N5UZC1_9BASI|nr:hypothetical protein PCANC_14404 [Puccinia coronata f. sp. avenae]
MACGASKNLNNFRNGLAIDLRHSGSTKMTTLACFILLIVQIAAMPAMDGVTSIGATLAQTGKISSKPSKASILEEGTSRDPVTSHPINYPRVDPIDLTGPVAKPASLNHENILAANQYAGKSEDTAATNRINYPRIDPDLTEARGPTTVPTTSNHENQVTAHEESPKKDEASLKKNKESLKLSSEPDDAPKKTPKPVAHEETPEVDPEKNLAPEVKAARKGFRKRLRKFGGSFGFEKNMIHPALTSITHQSITITPHQGMVMYRPRHMISPTMVKFNRIMFPQPRPLSLTMNHKGRISIPHQWRESNPITNLMALTGLILILPPNPLRPTQPH